MFHNVLMTSLTPLSDMNEIDCWANRPFAKVWPSTKQQEVNGSNLTKTIRKKNKRNRTTYTTDQLKVLEKVFTSSKYLDRDRRRELSQALGIAEKCLKIWFQNKRMKEKRISSESSDSMSESYPDSISSPQTEVEHMRTQHLHNDYKTDNVIKYSYSYNEGIVQSNTVETQMTGYDLGMSGNHQNFENQLPVYYSFYNDRNTYPTEYYSYHQIENNFNSEPNNQHYGYNSNAQALSNDNFDLSYLDLL